MVAQEVQDVEMENVDPEALKKEADLAAVTELREHAKQIEKSVTNKEHRFILRVLRSLPASRRKLNAIVLRGLLSQLYPTAEKAALIGYIEEATEPDLPRPKTVKTPVPEVDAYVHLLILLYLIDDGDLLKVQVSHYSSLNFNFNFFFYLFRLLIVPRNSSTRL